MRRVLAYVLILMMVISVVTFAEADDDQEITVGFVLCAPNNYVNIRHRSSARSESIGRFETGDMIYLDGKKQNGFLHCTSISLEYDDGWIHSGYVVYDKPEYLNQDATIVCRGRLAARKNVNGKRVRWLRSGATVKVYYWSDEWALTNCGYVRSEFLELEGI